MLDKFLEIWYINIAMKEIAEIINIDMKEKFVIENFISEYKGTTNFIDTAYFEAFYDSLDDKELYSHIVFNNDVLEIPPILTFVKYRQSVGDGLFNKRMEKTDKRCLGACFGFLFKRVLGYKRPVPKWVGEDKTDIKNASFFVKE